MARLDIEPYRHAAPATSFENRPPRDPDRRFQALSDVGDTGGFEPLVGAMIDRRTANA